MELLQIFSEVIMEKNPDFSKKSSTEQAEIITTTYDQIVKSALRKARIPPKKDIIRQIIEHKQYSRHSGKYRDKVKLTNYELVETLRNLRLSRPTKDSITDIESSSYASNMNSEILEGSSSSNEKETKPYYDFSIFANSNYHSHRSLFKTTLDNEIFKNKTKLQNHITRTKFQLEESLEEMYNFKNETEQQSFFKSTINAKEIHVSKSLFQLYELFNFLDFIIKLEKKQKSEYKQNFKEELKYSYKVLFEYYAKWLKIHGKIITKISELENEIFNNEKFMNLNYENPLFEGFTKLLENNIDMDKVKEFLNDPGVVMSFKEKSNESSEKTSPILKEPKQTDFDYEYEVIKYLSSEKTVKESDLRRRFLMYPISMTEILIKLEDLFLIERKKMQNDNLITFLTRVK